MSETYISVDIEADGPIPGKYSMLSLGAAAFGSSGELLETFSVNLEKMEGAIENPATMKFWEENKAAYLETRAGTVRPEEAMVRFSCWVKKYANPVFVGYPASYDFMFVYWYLIHFTGQSPFSFSAFDIKTAAALVLDCGYREATKRKMPKSWFRPGLKHTHVAAEDAVEQGHLFFKVMEAMKKLHEGRR